MFFLGHLVGLHCDSHRPSAAGEEGNASAPEELMEWAGVYSRPDPQGWGAAGQLDGGATLIVLY